MKQLHLLAVSLLALVGLGLAAFGRPGSPQDEASGAPTIDDVSWLAGHWRMKTPTGHVEELWMPGAGGVMLGLNRTVDEGRRAAFEYLRIEQRADGLHYIASPSGGAATEFRWMVTSEDEAVFENPEHDFPKLIHYRLEDGNLTASIAGDEPGPSWTFERVGDVN